VIRQLNGNFLSAINNLFFHGSPRQSSDGFFSRRRQIIIASLLLPDSKRPAIA
jgi:hypothetical protein